MSLGSAKEVENLLGRLGNLITCDQDSDLCSAKDLIIDVSELLSTESKSIHYDLCLSLTLGDNGLLHFCRQTVTKNQFGDAKKSALEIIKALLEKQTSKLLNHAKEILLVSQQLYRVDVAAKVRIAALELLGALLLKAPPDVISQHLDLNSLITSLCVSIKSAKVPSVVHHELELLGLLTFALPGETQGQASFLLKVLCDQLNRHTGKRPDLTILAGSVRGLTYYLHHFPHGAEDVPELYKDLYGRLHKIIDPNLQLPKREAPRVTLELLHQHAAKFSHELLVRHRTLFPWLLRWSCAYNRDDLKAGRRAMDSFLAVVASELELNPSKLSHDAFCYLVGEFSRLLESGVHPGETSKNSLPGVSSTSYCVSLAVRGYGLFAGACKQLLAPEQLVVLFSTVLTASQHAFYQSSELLDTKLASLPTFVRALAAILKQMPEVEWPSVNGVLELSVALVRNYPDLGAAQRAHAHTAILALLVAATSTSRLSCILHLWVHQSILVTCSHDTETADEGTAAKNIPAEAGGHWRGVADEPTSYKSYLPLWSVLLSAQRASRITLPGRSW
ncbi:Armadillo-type fold [Trinorchestia longiramus]|nr:Armadillo-type fold [Trinorchestia longiramus]